MKISIITPSFNSVDYIERAILSVLNQGYDNFEHIIMDNCSTDGTLEILKKYSHLRWKSEKDKGQSDAMNKGFELSTGDIIVYLNCDDYFLPNSFNQVIPLFKKGSKFVVGNVLLQLEDGREFTIKPNVTYKKMLKHWEHAAFPNNPVQYFYRREVQEKFPFNTNNKKTMDLEFLCEAASHYKFEKIDYTLGVYPLLEGAVSVVAQKDPFYWTFETFSFLDKHLLNYEQNEILSFKKEQQKAYLERSIQAISQNKTYDTYEDLCKDMKQLVSVSFFKNPFKKYQYYKQAIKSFSRTGC